MNQRNERTRATFILETDHAILIELGPNRRATLQASRPFICGESRYAAGEKHSLPEPRQRGWAVFVRALGNVPGTVVVTWR